tara:strand:- start:1084 stop:3453 length:2370 start_codon:yes stop_codon:yes gene_type:complete
MTYKDFVNTVIDDISGVSPLLDEVIVHPERLCKIFDFNISIHNDAMNGKEPLAGAWKRFAQLSRAAGDSRWIEFVLSIMLHDDDVVTTSFMYDVAINAFEIATGQSLKKESATFSLVGEKSLASVAKELRQSSATKDGERFFLITLLNNINYVTREVSKMPSQGESKKALGVLNWVCGHEAMEQLVVSTKDRVREISLRLKPESVEVERFVESLPIEVVIQADDDYASLKKFSLKMNEASTSSASPVYSKLIYSFKSIDDLANKITGLPDGFALVAIINSNPADSYFSIVCKEGGNITLLSDTPDYSHPLQETRMAGRNNRYNHTRIDGSMFPYQLLNLQWSDSERSVEQKAMSKELVDPNTNIEVLGAIDNLSNTQALWLSYLFECCYYDFYIGNAAAPSLALLNESTLTIGNKKKVKSNLPVKLSEHSVSLPEAKKLTGEKLVEHYPDLRRTGVNDWMEKRFDEDIKSELLYPVGDTDEILLEYKGASRAKSTVTVKKDALVSLPGTKLLDTDSAIRDSVYIARHNKAKLIEEMVYAEFETRAKLISDWVYKSIVKNIPNLIDDLVSLNHSRFYCSASLSKEEQGQFGARQIHLIKNEGSFIRNKSEVSELIRRLKLYKQGWANCYINNKILGEFDEPADHYLVLKIDSVWDLVNVTGVPRDKLPVELQNYKARRKGGVSILDATDEMEGITNPYDQLRFTFSLPVSKDALNEYRKQLGLKQIRKLPPNLWEVSSEGKEIENILGYWADSGIPINYSHNKPDYAFYTTMEIRSVEAVVNSLCNKDDS